MLPPVRRVLDRSFNGEPEFALLDLLLIISCRRGFPDATPASLAKPRQ
jgi:hypothetical protein